MCEKLSTNSGVISSGVISIGLVIAFLVCQDDLFYSFQGDFFDRLQAAQILTSVLLIIGVVKGKYKFYIPWMISTLLLAYGLLYNTVVIRFEEMVYRIIYILIGGYLICALNGAYNSFEEMRNANQPNAVVESEKLPTYRPPDEKAYTIDI
ncbi:uncharacterized protein LOC115634335 [Scaptodrosophila lebanonensis]|uniref:Uncharacterized protein LOC115634335 n=1 Tax=Drosophila lebanonensis TaxID=7225 RepID=A0A6J2UHD1_DROLE|nr:uncharacterized protein LOC115634335 [Scaptodrosophila lebanonensis]